jgi:hypothetical protein
MKELRCAWCEDPATTTTTVSTATSNRLPRSLKTIAGDRAGEMETHGIRESCRVGAQELMRLAAETSFPVAVARRAKPKRSSD